jgi:hypothetical protein
MERNVLAACMKWAALQSTHPQTEEPSRCHACHATTCDFVESGNILICIRSGNIHACGTQCDYQKCRQGEGPVCQITNKVLPMSLEVPIEDLINGGKLYAGPYASSFFGLEHTALHTLQDSRSHVSRTRANYQRQFRMFARRPVAFMSVAEAEINHLVTTQCGGDALLCILCPPSMHTRPAIAWFMFSKLHAHISSFENWNSPIAFHSLQLLLLGIHDRGSLNVRMLQFFWLCLLPVARELVGWIYQASAAHAAAKLEWFMRTQLPLQQTRFLSAHNEPRGAPAAAAMPEAYSPWTFVDALRNQYILS